LVVNRIFVHGLGAVSPAGWSVAALRAALGKNVPLPTASLARPGLDQPLRVRPVPPPAVRPAFLAHPRLRRASAIAQHVVGAALEALGADAPRVEAGALRLGVIVCTLAGSVAYSRRFYEEVLREPATASPLLFPETVFNAPASHLAAFLGSTGINYSLVGDDGTFLRGLALAAQWLAQDRVDGCVVVGAEELDWIVADAVRLFHRTAIHSAGAGALYLKRGVQSAECGMNTVELAAVTDSFLFTAKQTRALAAQKMREQLPPAADGAALWLGAQDIARLDSAELAAWADWTGPRFAPKQILGEAFAASAAWQTVAGCDALRAGEFSAVNVSVVGANEQAIGARFLKTSDR
jgi:hypothetical protein